MGKVKFFKKKNEEPIKEEDSTEGTSNDNNQAQNAQQNQQAVTIYNQIAQLDKNIADEEKKCADAINNFKQQKVQLQKQLADLGLSVGTTESIKIASGMKFKVYEAYENSAKKEELSEILKSAFDNAEISYTFDNRYCDKMARYVLDKMNDRRFDKEKDNSEEFLDILMNYEKIKSKGYTDNEKKRLRDCFEKAFTATDNEYSWVFKNKKEVD